jgi:hypothetical protein
MQYSQPLAIMSLLTTKNQNTSLLTRILVCYLDAGSSSKTSLNVTVLSVGNVFLVIAYFLCFLFVIATLRGV